MAASKVLMLKPGEFEICRMRIEQYFQMMDYALWDDAKQLMEAIEKRFGRNASTKKTQRNLLKQQYENFTASNSEMLDQTFDRLQNLVYEPKVKGMPSSNSSTQTWLLYLHQTITALMKQLILLKQLIPLLEFLLLALKRDGFKMVDGHVDNEGQKVLEENRKEVDRQWEHLPKECRAPRSQDTKHKKDCTCETPTSTTLVSCDGLGGYDWSDQAKVGNFMPPKPDLFYIGLDEFAVKPVVENKSSED
nr:ribonuclease H-like domain-containing protein [Tanacetum cinerariifolium]